MDEVNACVIGAGAVGLATARALAGARKDVLVLEAGERFGEGISSRNSEVIHAGIYYATDSLKATLCVAGKRMLYDYCAERGVGCRKLGKLIVATNSLEDEQLEGIKSKAEKNGVDDLRFVSCAELSTREPNITATSAIYSPSTGIVSSHELMTSFVGDLEANGGALACHAKVVRIECEQNSFVLHCDIEGKGYRFRTRQLVNASGLNAQSVASAIDGLPNETIPALYLCKGTYFLLPGKCPFNHLIYPVPDETGAGLGVHATIDLGGQLKFGPDVEYIEKEDYRVSQNRLESSYTAIRRYFPSLRDGHLIPGYVGIRPKLQAPNEGPKDFMIQSGSDFGLPGLVNLYGIESPGLTSSMAIAETVLSLLHQASQ